MHTSAWLYVGLISERARELLSLNGGKMLHISSSPPLIAVCVLIVAYSMVGSAQIYTLEDGSILFIDRRYSDELTRLECLKG